MRQRERVSLPPWEGDPEDKIEDLEYALRIDEYALEEAVQRNPDLFYRVARQTALAISRRDEAKQDWEDAKADADLDVRNAIQEGDRYPETAIQQDVRRDKKVRSAYQSFLTAKKQVQRWEALERAYEKRSMALNKLVDLSVANYFSDTPNNSRNMGQVRDIRVKEIKRSLADKRREAEKSYATRQRD